MSRLAAKARCNYYPLPDAEADLIRSCMTFPDRELSALDPCAGEGRALAVITASSRAVRYGIELDSYRAGAATKVLEHDFLFAGERLQNLPLACGEILGDTVRRDVAAGQEAHTHRAGLLDELRLGVSCLDAQLDDLLHAPAPSFHKAAPIEDFRDERIPRPGEVIPLQVIDAQPKRQGAIAPDLQPIIVDRQAH